MNKNDTKNLGFLITKLKGFAVVIPEKYRGTHTLSCFFKHIEGAYSNKRVFKQVLMHHFINEFKIVTKSNLEEFIECCKELNSQLIKLEDVDNWKRYLYFYQHQN